MTRNVVTALLVALLLHGCILAFGGLLFFHDTKAKKVVEEVDILSAAESEDKKEKEREKAETQADKEKGADADADLTEKAAPMPVLQAGASEPTGPAGPALDAMSLSELEGVLSPDATGGTFAESFSLASGGRIGANGGDSTEDAIAEAFSSADLDQKPRPILTVEPSYPVELRKRHLEGTVSVVFLVGTDGKVRNVEVEKSTNPSFDRPAVDAIRQWRFEPGTRKGEKVEFKMRQPVSFRAS